MVVCGLWWYVGCGLLWYVYSGTQTVTGTIESCVSGKHFITHETARAIDLNLDKGCVVGPFPARDPCHSNRLAT